MSDVQPIASQGDKGFREAVLDREAAALSAMSEEERRDIADMHKHIADIVLSRPSIDEKLLKWLRAHDEPSGYEVRRVRVHVSPNEYKRASPAVREEFEKANLDKGEVLGGLYKERWAVFVRAPHVELVLGVPYVFRVATTLETPEGDYVEPTKGTLQRFVVDTTQRVRIAGVQKAIAEMAAAAKREVIENEKAASDHRLLKFYEDAEAMGVLGRREGQIPEPIGMGAARRSKGNLIVVAR